MLRQATQNLITALYPRLSHEDELQGESNSISNHEDIFTGQSLFPVTLFPICCLTVTFWDTPNSLSQSSKTNPVEKRHSMWYTYVTIRE